MAKVAINYDGGFRNRMTFVLTGLDQEVKAAWLERAIVDNMGGADGARRGTMETRFVPVPSDGPDQERSSGLLHVSVKSPDERAVGRAFSSAAIELALANYPGFFAHRSARTGAVPTGCTGRRWCPPVRSSRSSCSTTARGCESTRRRPDRRRCRPIEAPAGQAAPLAIEPGTPLGRHFGARSGDKGGNANLGVWARDDAGYAWLDANLTVERVRRAAPRGR